ncbi:MAG: uroporphyrinogen-III C-methyltransferase [Pseudomonadales bacterium]|nr:uroporphyrinogen-III C-methyltransferase [Pseudomonadales bacterium]MCP5184115.1 uroporphyrinogen-III C-methyltransferase [Pseudomonadales bacterium]
MSEDTNPAADEGGETSDRGEQDSVRQGGGSGKAWLALLVALAALGGSGWLYYRLVYLAPGDDTQAKIDAYAETVNTQILNVRGALEARFTDAIGKATGPLNERVEVQEKQLEQRLGAVEAAMADLVAKAPNAGPPDPEKWKLAEVGFLLRIANHRLLIEGKAAEARALLENADGLLAEIDDFRLHAVREEIADELVALGQVPRAADTEGLYLSLEAMKPAVARLIAASPVLAPSSVPATDPGASVWQMILDRFAAIVRVRRVERPDLKPMLSPDERRYVEFNLHLGLEQAQLGALRGEQAVFDTAIANVRKSLVDLLPAETTGLSEFLLQLDGIAGAQLQQELPDISGSLRALRNVLRESA